jgi:hypothetical protein
MERCPCLLLPRFFLVHPFLFLSPSLAYLYDVTCYWWWVVRVCHVIDLTIHSTQTTSSIAFSFLNMTKRRRRRRHHLLFFFCYHVRKEERYGLGVCVVVLWMFFLIASTNHHHLSLTLLREKEETNEVRRHTEGTTLLLSTSSPCRCRLKGCRGGILSSRY